MNQSRVCARVYLLVQPEDEPAPFAVSLWTAWPAEAREQILAAPSGSWHDFSRRMEQTGILDSRTLGRLDAHIGRGESIVHGIDCTLDDLHAIGLREVSKRQSKQIPAPLLKLSAGNIGRGSSSQPVAP